MKCRSKQFLYKICLVVALLIPQIVFAQNGIRISGTVTDASSGETLIGVSVSQKGAANVTMTDVDGKYSLNNVPQNATIVFTYMGYESVEMQAKEGALNVALKESSKQLSEIVVIGYGTQRKADLTTSVASVSADEWADRPIISAQQAIQGKAAGVQVVQPSGKPGVGMQVRVRGTTSLNAGNDPIYVVDGIITNDITNVSPSDIESMQILKDASSAAIYGSRASNGVVLITTKKGSKGRTQVDLSMYAGFSNVSKQIKTLNTSQYYDLMDEIGISMDHTNHNYINWAKEMYGTAVQQNYQVSLSGSTDKINYYVSGGYQKEDGIIKPATYDRYSFRTNLSSDVQSWLKVTTNLSFARNGRRDVTDNANSGRGGVIMSILNTPTNIPIWDPANEGQYQSDPNAAARENPYGQTDTYDMNREYRFMGNLELDFTILEGLHFKPRFSVDYTDHAWDKFIDPVKTQYGRQANGRGEHADDNYLTWQSENILSYNKKFDGKHNFSALAGITMQRFRHENAYMSLSDFVLGTTYETMTLNMANKIDNASTEKNGNSLMSYLTRVQYDYESRYLFTANFRADGSSKLYHKWAYFPSLSAGWRFSSEKFFEPLTGIVDDAKLRIGWGRNGNQGGIKDYDSYDKYTITRQKETGYGPAIKQGRLGNRDLSWEITTQYNAGLDFTLFNTRLTGEVDLYYKKTTDLLLYITLPATAGVDLPMRNGGEMINKGLEFNLNGQILTGAFKWDAGVNMSFNRNKLTKLGLTKQFPSGNIETNGGNIILVKEGLALGTFYGYIAQGVDPETGNLIYKDLNNNGVYGVNDSGVDSGDRTVIGNAQPDFTFGITQNFSWKNFTLSAFFNGSYGNDIFNASRIDLESMLDSKNQSTAVLNRWVRPGMVTDIPRAIYNNNRNVLNSTRFVEDGSYIRLKSLTLSYTFDKKVLNTLRMSKLNVYGTVNNLFTLTKYRGYDPELSWTDSNNAAQMGIDYGTYPQSRSFIFGLNLTF